MTAVKAHRLTFMQSTNFFGDGEASSRQNIKVGSAQWAEGVAGGTKGDRASNLRVTRICRAVQKNGPAPATFHSVF
jgi:hypothetical protein